MADERRIGTVFPALAGKETEFGPRSRRDAPPPPSTPAAGRRPPVVVPSSSAPSVLGVCAGLLTLTGLGVALLDAESALHKVAALIVLLTAMMTIAGALILEGITFLRREIWRYHRDQSAYTINP
jgi:hypothetical protein